MGDRRVQSPQALSVRVDKHVFYHITSALPVEVVRISTGNPYAMSPCDNISGNVSKTQDCTVTGRAQRGCVENRGVVPVLKVPVAVARASFPLS
jgi:hypothetical protein